MAAVPTENIADLLTTYFFRGHRYAIIKALLKKRHGIYRSLRWIKTKLASSNLRRNGLHPSPGIVGLVHNVQNETDRRAGYRRTWRIINQRYRHRATQLQVRTVLLQINPSAVRRRANGVLIRRSYYSAGPNHVWHCDGYDKLKPYGFAIHGCIDGFSRRIIWVHCGSTNNDPKVILGYYLKAVRTIGGCPKLVRSDCGTETGLVAAAQTTLVNNNRAHVYGPSYRNQRIEQWWSVLRKGWSQIWIELFEDLMRFSYYDPSHPFHASLASFCFMPIIKQELNDFVKDHNYKRITGTRTSGVPGGIPEELFALPEEIGFSDQLQRINMNNLDLLVSEVAIDPPSTPSPEIHALCMEFMTKMNLSYPVDRKSATNTFLLMLKSLV